MHHQAPITLPGKIGNVVAFLHIKGWLRIVDGVGWFDRLAVALEDPAWPPLCRHFGDIFLCGFTTPRSVCWTCAPQHRIGVLTVSCNVCHIRLTTILIEAIDSLLKVSFVHFISSRWFMSPEHARLSRTLFIICKRVLALDEGPDAWVTERAVHHTLSRCEGNVILSLSLSYFFNLLQPFRLERSVLLHSFSQTHWQTRLEAIVHACIEKVVIGFQRFKGYIALLVQDILKCQFFPRHVAIFFRTKEAILLSINRVEHALIEAHGQMLLLQARVSTIAFAFQDWGGVSINERLLISWAIRTSPSSHCLI